MKLKNKHFYYIVGLVIALITFIPPMPTALKYILSIIPILFFGADLTIMCMEEIYKKNFINRHLTGILVSLGAIITGKPAYAAITMIFFSAASFYFGMLLAKASRRIDESSNIIAPCARTLIDGKPARVSVGAVVPGQLLILAEGDIVPCDCTAVNGEAEIDYTNVFGNGTVRTVNPGASCFSGGIVQSGRLTVRAEKTHKESLAHLINRRFKKAQALSSLQKRILGWTTVFQYAVYVISFLLFIILLIATKDFPLAVNQASVILVTSPIIGVMESLPLLNRNALLTARRRGVIFTDVSSLEQSGRLQTVSPNEAVSQDVINKIEETKAIVAKGGYTELDGVIYRDNTRLEADSNPSFKLALGFFSPKAQAAALDPKPERIAGAIRTGRNHRTVVTQNLILPAVAKLTVAALVLLLNINPATAIIIEFITWMACLANATRENI